MGGCDGSATRLIDKQITEEQLMIEILVSQALHIIDGTDCPGSTIAHFVPDQLNMMKEMLGTVITTTDLNQYESYKFNKDYVFKWKDVDWRASVFSKGGPYRYSEDFGIMGTFYWGNYKEGRREGFGCKVFPSINESYVGFFENNMFNGKGALIVENHWYIGDFQNNVINGNGVYKSLKTDDKYFYAGGFKVAVKHGKGKLYLSDGSWYEGEFRDGCKHGKGEFSWPDGASYIGVFFQGKYAYNIRLHIWKRSLYIQRW